MSGPFYFAWADPATAFDSLIHAVEDEDVFSFSLSQDEGDFANLTITIRNPRIGLLNPSRKVWLWFSWFNGTTVVPKFYGRLVGIPTNIFAELVTLEFTARPADFAQQKVNLADTLKEAPYWNPIFITEEALNNPDTVLEGRSQLWHVDPVTHAVTVSDVLVGEDGVVDFTESQLIDGTISVTMGTPPARSVTMTMDVNWDNHGTGNVSLDYELLRNWPQANDKFSYQLISSYSFAGLVSDWPEPGKSIGKGWSVYSSDLRDNSFETAWTGTTNLFPTWVDQREIFGAPYGSFFIKNWPQEYKVLGEYPPKTIFDVEPWIDTTDLANIIVIPLGWGRPHLTIQYDVSRRYSETITFTLNCDMQDVVTLPGEDDTILLNLSGNTLTDSIDGAIRIDPRRTSFFDTDDGLAAVGHGVAVCRAQLIIRSRVVKISFQTMFEFGNLVTLRKNALVHYSALPGGQAVGKITSYVHELDGTTGTLISTITLEAAVGRGGSYTASAGDPTYVAEGYVQPGYQQYENVVNVLPSTDVTYSVTPYVANDDGFIMTRPLYATDVVNSVTIEDGPIAQYDAMSAVVYAFDSGAVKNVLQQHPTKISLHLKPAIGGPFATSVEVVVQDLVIPKQIDLEAASA
jgi:hypothetical protein